MAVTSIWAIKRSLSEVVNYVKNPDKTTGDALTDVISYAVNSEKTAETDDENTENIISFVTGINCYSTTAIDEMIAVKKHYGKTDGIIAYHGYQSFASGETTPEMAHEIGI